MANGMHPELLAFLRQNLVELGGSLDRLNANHAEVLSLITGTQRSRRSAHSILDGEFHLTGDAIFKMQAIAMPGRARKLVAPRRGQQQVHLHSSSSGLDSSGKPRAFSVCSPACPRRNSSSYLLVDTSNY